MEDVRCPSRACVCSDSSRTHSAISIDLARGPRRRKKTWDFETDEPGKIAKGFTNEVGQWEVAKDGDNHVLYQKAKNDDATSSTSPWWRARATRISI